MKMPKTDIKLEEDPFLRLGKSHLYTTLNNDLMTKIKQGLE